MNHLLSEQYFRFAYTGVVGVDNNYISFSFIRSTESLLCFGGLLVREVVNFNMTQVLAEQYFLFIQQVGEKQETLIPFYFIRPTELPFELSQVRSVEGLWNSGKH